MDEVGIARLERLVVDSQTRRGPFRHVVVDHIGELGQAHDCFEPLGALDVDGEIELAALAPDEGHPSHAHAVTADGLHLDDLGPQVSEDHRTERAREILAEVEDHDTAQGTHDTSSTIPASSRRSISAEA